MPSAVVWRSMPAPSTSLDSPFSAISGSELDGVAMVQRVERYNKNKGKVAEGDVEVVVVESINIKSLRAGAQVHINDLRIPRAH
jgi:hypothetical protein